MHWWLPSQEERADEASRREAVEVALHSTRTQFARTRSRLKRFQVPGQGNKASEGSAWRDT